MFDLKLLERINEEFALKRLSFGKREKDFNAGRDVRFGKLHGIFSPSYWKRDQLFAFGKIYYGLAFKSYINEFGSDRSIATWVLFSPSGVIQNNPHFYYQIADKLNDVLQNPHLSKSEKRIKAVLEGYLYEPSYLEIPEPYNLGYLCYICMCYVRANHFSDFRLGINLVVSAKKTSNEIVYLPEIYWNEKFKNLYYKKPEVKSE